LVIASEAVPDIKSSHENSVLRLLSLTTTTNPPQV
jgi:hypothetical protein